MNAVKRIFKNQRIRRFISCCCFLLLLIHVFLTATALFRHVSQDRIRIAGLKNEKTDMVHIGGSAAFVYWIPMQAWMNYGFTSYNYAWNSIAAESLLPTVKEVQRSNHPSLYVVGIRSLEYWNPQGHEAGLRNFSDSLNPFSLNRNKMVYDYLNNRHSLENTDKLSYYLDIVKYHKNTSNLADMSAWSFITRQIRSPGKGWDFVPAVKAMETPADFRTDERGEIPDTARDILVELLEYCKDENLNVLFTVCPFSITKEQQARFNTLGDMIESYGFSYLNANEFYDEMNIDFSCDFYDKDHVNMFGAEKYTKFLGDYITANYEMPNHKQDESYADWNQEAQTYEEKKDERHCILQEIKESESQTAGE